MAQARQPFSQPEKPAESAEAQEQVSLKETGRIEAFSDGIFAVAITLLILNIHIPIPKEGEIFTDDGTLGKALLNDWPVYLAFVTSFLTIGIMWVNHHRLFNFIKSSDDALLVLNLLLLMFIVFVPFPTSLLAKYITPGNSLPAEIYSGTYVILAICFNLLWGYASHRNQLIDKKADPQMVRAITRQYRFGPLLYLIAFGLAFVSAPASIVWNLLLALFYALPGSVVTGIGLRWRRQRNRASQRK
jgi:uncharacterized membrane protein